MLEKFAVVFEIVNVYCYFIIFCIIFLFDPCAFIYGLNKSVMKHTAWGLLQTCPRACTRVACTHAHTHTHPRRLGSLEADAGVARSTAYIYQSPNRMTTQ